MSRPRLALLFLCALLTVELTLHNHSLIPGDGSAAAVAAQQATCPACATTSGNLAPQAPRLNAPVRVAYALAAPAVLMPVHGELLCLPSRAPPQA
ncbi:MAG TPA: hypothetical protein VGR02_03915 [Thermoanaerobaculia bacterium]|nr:hypothetical protein [Thermoanaerobaculia bacterium]